MPDLPVELSTAARLLRDMLHAPVRALTDPVQRGSLHNALDAIHAQQTRWSVPPAPQPQRVGHLFGVSDTP